MLHRCTSRSSPVAKTMANQNVPLTSVGRLSTVMSVLLAFICISSVRDVSAIDSSPCLACSQNQAPPLTITISPDDSSAADDESCYPDSFNRYRSLTQVPCKTLDFALQFTGHSENVVFYLASPNITYHLYNVTTFDSKCGICVHGNSSMYPTLPIVQCVGKDAGLSFVSANNIVIDGVKFLHCGSRQNSTSKDLSKPDTNVLKLLTVQVALYFYNCTNVKLHRVAVSNSSNGIGVLMYDTDGVVNVTESKFMYNCYSIDKEVRYYGGGGFAVEFTYCFPGDDKCNNTNFDQTGRKNKHATYYFTNCTYEGNYARGQNSTDFGGALSISSNVSHQGIGRGGGLSFYFKGDAAGNIITITNCVFFNNSAVWGGGLFVELDDNSTDNKVYLHGCNFTGNCAYHDRDYGTGGGGFHIASNVLFWKTDYDGRQNLFLLDRIRFTQNRALEGGGLQLSLTPKNSDDHLVIINITNSDFENNQAGLGSAVTVSKYQITNGLYMPEVVFTSCSFRTNQIIYSSEIVHPVGLGAVYIDEVPVVFNGSILFKNNSGSALAITGTRVTFNDKTTATFVGNQGLLGGGIAILGTAFIQIGEQSTMNFSNNHASQYGGAIYNHYTTRKDLSSSISCFIRYNKPFIPPTDWNVEFYFKNNSAAKTGKSIYSTAILPCRYGLDITPFCWNDTKWNYDGESCKDQIYTLANNFSLLNKSTQVNHGLISAYPGKEFRLPLHAWDDLSHDVSKDTVYYAYTNGTLHAKVEEGFSYVANGDITITGKPDSNHTNITLALQTEGSRIMHVILNFSLTPCPPGFRLSPEKLLPSKSKGSNTHNDDAYSAVDFTDGGQDKHDSNLQCMCFNDMEYQGLLRCSDGEFNASIDFRYWLGSPYGCDQHVDSEDLLIGYLYYRSDDGDRPNDNNFMKLPNNTDSLNDFFCGKFNRQGVLCGECRPGYAVAVNSLIYECVQCNSTLSAKDFGNIVAYIGLTYVPIIALFITIVCCNMKLASSAASGFLLFAQVTGSLLFKTTSHRRLGHAYDSAHKVYRTIYGIFNLESFAIFLHPFCLNKHFTTLHVLCLDYAIAAFPLVVIITIYLFYYCKARCPNRERKQVSIIAISKEDSFSDSELSHHENTQRKSPKSRVVHSLVAFLLLSYTKFSLASIKTLIFTDLYTSTSKVMHRSLLAGHLSFNHRSYRPFGAFAILVLIFIVLLPPLLLLGPLQLLDWLTDKNWCCQTVRDCWRKWSIRIQIIQDTFQGYKHNRRFFLGIYLIYRLIIFLTIMYPIDTVEFILQQMATFTLAILVALFRPYEKDFYNNLDTLLIFNLGIINLLTMFTYVNKQILPGLFVVKCVLVFLPLLYIMCYAIWNKVHKREKYKSVKKKIFSLVNPVTSHGEEGTTEERQHLITGSNIFGESINYTGDEDEDVFQRAARGNRFRRSNSSFADIHTRPPGKAGEIAKTVVSIASKIDEDREQSKSGIDSGISAGQTASGGSSQIDTKGSE